jgi:hypothetical protein
VVVLEGTAKWGIVDASRRAINVQVHVLAMATAAQIRTIVNSLMSKKLN